MVANKNKSEKNKDKKIDILKLIHYGIVLMIFSSVSALILIGTHDLTKATVAKHLKQEIEEARESVLPGTVKFVDNKALKVGKLEYIPGYDKNKKVIGYVINLSKYGYSSLIKFVLGISVDGKVTGLKVVDQTETPGLGTNIEDPKWQKHWIGKTKKYQFNKSVDAFAGSTISPKAIYDAMANALLKFPASKGAK